MYQHQGSNLFHIGALGEAIRIIHATYPLFPNTHGLRFEGNIFLVLEPYAPLGPLLPLVDRLGLTKGVAFKYIEKS